jgi:hypothetical protein
LLLVFALSPACVKQPIAARLLSRLSLSLSDPLFSYPHRRFSHRRYPISKLRSECRARGRSGIDRGENGFQ